MVRPTEAHVNAIFWIWARRQAAGIPAKNPPPIKAPIGQSPSGATNSANTGGIGGFWRLVRVPINPRGNTYI